MKYINNLDSIFLVKFSKDFFKKHYNSDNIFIEKAGNSCIVKCFVNNKHTLLISLKDFSVECNDVLCGMLAKSQLQKFLAKHYGEQYLIDLKEDLNKDINLRYNNGLNKINRHIKRVKEQVEIIK